MKKTTDNYYCDLCGNEIKGELKTLQNASLFQREEVKTANIDGIFGLLSKKVFKIWWFEYAWGKSFNELCENCAGEITETIKRLRK